MLSYINIQIAPVMKSIFITFSCSVKLNLKMTVKIVNEDALAKYLN